MEEVTFGLPVPNRANGAYKRTAGLFVNQSPVKFCAERNLSFAELLGRISTTLKAVYRHKRLPASEIRRAVGAEVAQSRLFAVRLDFVYNQAYFKGGGDPWSAEPVRPGAGLHCPRQRSANPLRLNSARDGTPAVGDGVERH